MVYLKGETCEVEVAKGKTLIIKLVEIGKINNAGLRRVIFEVNGNRREIEIKDKAQIVREDEKTVKLADKDNPKEIGSSIPGTILNILVKKGEMVKENQIVAVIEAMKMETNVIAGCDGEVSEVFVKAGDMVKSGELLIELA